MANPQNYLTEVNLKLNEDSFQAQNQINNSHPINMGHFSTPSDPPPPFPGSSPPQFMSSQQSFPGSGPSQFMSSQQPFPGSGPPQFMSSQQPFPGSGPPQFQSSQQQGFSNQPSQQQMSSIPQSFNQFPQGQQQYFQQVNQGQYSQKQQPHTYQQANMGFSPTQQQMRNVSNQQQTSALPHEQVIYVEQPPPPSVMVMNPNQDQNPGIVSISSHTPVIVTCPYCNNIVITSVTKTIGSPACVLVIVLILLILLIIFIVCLPFTWISCILPNFKGKIHSCIFRNKVHSCTSCGNTLAVVTT